MNQQNETSSELQRGPPSLAVSGSADGWDDAWQYPSGLHYMAAKFPKRTVRMFLDASLIMCDLADKNPRFLSGSIMLSGNEICMTIKMRRKRRV